MPYVHAGNQPIDARLLRTIHAAAREHGVDRDGLHDTIALIGKKSLKDLTRREAYNLLDGIRAAAGASRPRDQRRRNAQASHGRRDYDAAADAIYPVTEREREMLADAADLRGWSEATLTDFIQRQLGKPVVVTMADFNKVFWALKAMNRRAGVHK